MGSSVKKNKELFQIANNQQGLFTAKQAEEIGFINTNHSYHVSAGHWLREGRGLYRLAVLPKSPDEQKVLYTLWSKNRAGEIQGVYSHETALAHYELSDINPSKLTMTVPKSFRRNSKIPKILKLHYSDLSKAMIFESRGFWVTKVGRTITDIIQCGWISFDIIQQAIFQAHEKGLMPKYEIQSIIENVPASPEMRKLLNQIERDL